jgi:hypothetical protein
MTQGGKIYIIEGKTDGIVCIFLVNLCSTLHSNRLNILKVKQMDKQDSKKEKARTF